MRGILIIHRIKKLVLWTLIGLYLSSSFLITLAIPQKAKAVDPACWNPQPPGTNINLTTKNDKDGIILSWKTSVIGISGLLYRVWKSENNGSLTQMQGITVGSETADYAFTDKQVEDGKTYNYQIEANNSGQKACSDVKSITYNTTTTSSVPPCPTNLIYTVNTTKNTFTLTWDWTWPNKPSGAAVTYKIEKRNTTGGSTNWVDITANDSDTSDMKAELKQVPQVNEDYRVIPVVNGLTPNKDTCTPVTITSGAGGVVPPDETCGATKVKGYVANSLVKVLCAILIGLGELGQWLIDGLGIDTVINAQAPNSFHLSAFLPVQKTFAAATTPGESSIKNALNGDPDWVLKAWKTVLALANVFVVIVLLFLAITNILNIQYDTYAIKKSLPYLILGIILANFSIFITKMLVDATNVLTSTFTGGDPGLMIREIITAVVPDATTGKLGFMSTPGLGTLLIAVLFGFFVIIALLILGFLFYIRYIVILALTVAAPLAFVLMAFPPTQGIFKQWWGWYARFIFMKPISIFLVWLAWKVIQAGGNEGITPWAIAVFLICAAIIIPFKLGGFVMQGWGALGKKYGLGGLKAGGKFAANRADYGMAKKFGWSPKSMYEAYKMGSEEKRERAYSLATGKSRDIQTSAFSLGQKQGGYFKQAERTWGLKVIKQEVGDADLKSREGLAEAFQKLYGRGDKASLQLLLEDAAKDYMVADIMGELSPELKVKLGYGKDEKINDDFDSQQDFIGRVIGKDNLEGYNRIEEAYVKSGIATGKRHPLNENKTGYELANLDKQTMMAVKRFQSAEPIKAIRNFRLDSIISKDGGLTELGKNFLQQGGLTAGHLSLLERGYGRQSTYIKALDPKNEKFWSEIGQFKEGQDLQNAIQKAGYTKTGAVENAGTVQAPEVKDGHIVPNSIASAEIAHLTPEQITPQVKADIAAKISTMPIDGLKILGEKVGANQNLGDLSALVGSMTKLKTATEKAGKLRSQTREQADLDMSEIAQTVGQEIGAAMKLGKNPGEVISEVVQNAKLMSPEVLQKMIRDNLVQSSSTIISPKGQNISSSQLINIYQQISEKTAKDPVKTRLEFSSALDQHGANENEKVHAWDLIEAYEGKTRAPKDKSPKENKTDFEELFELEE